MQSRPSSAPWIGAALAANLILAAIILLLRGADAHGTENALQMTARVSFLWFWVAYAGGALVTLFGPTFLPFKQHAREFGLAFAAALLVHLMLVSWLCWIGEAPAAGVFLFFGSAASVTYLLAAFSFGNLHAVLGAWGWQLFRIVGMNFILYAFFVDFVHPIHGGILHLAAYLPFAVMVVLAPLLRLAAWAMRLRKSDRFPGHAFRPPA